MRKLSATTALATIAILLASPAVLAQGSGSASPGSMSTPELTSPPGTYGTGTAQSGSRLNSGEGVTTGTANSQSVDQAIANENKSIDSRLKGICRGC